MYKGELYNIFKQYLACLSLSLVFSFIFDHILAVQNTCMKTNKTILEFLVPVVESTHNKVFEAYQLKWCISTDSTA